MGSHYPHYEVRSRSRAQATAAGPWLLGLGLALFELSLALWMWGRATRGYAPAPARSRCGSPVIGIELSSGVEHALSSMCVYSLKIATASVRDFLNQKRLTNSNGFEFSENLNCTCFPPTSRTGQSAPCFCPRRQIRDVEI